MKLNRFIALVAIALLVVGAMGAIVTRSFAQGSNAPSVQSQDCSQDQADGAEVQNAPDTDNVELQCGDQNAPDGQESVGAADTDNVEEQVGDQSGADTGVEAPEVEAPSAP